MQGNMDSSSLHIALTDYTVLERLEILSEIFFPLHLGTPFL